MTQTQENWEGGQEVKSNWFKFEKVGDRVKGTLVNKRFQKSANPTFADQWVYELKTPEGTVYNVGIPVTKQGTVQRLNNCQMGEIVGVWFEKEGEPSAKGFAKAKYLKVLTFGMDPDYKGFQGGEEQGETEHQF